MICNCSEWKDERVLRFFSLKQPNTAVVISIDRFPENRPQFVVYLLILLGPGTPACPLCVKYVSVIA